MLTSYEDSPSGPDRLESSVSTTRFPLILCVCTDIEARVIFATSLQIESAFGLDRNQHVGPVAPLTERGP